MKLIVSIKMVVKETDCFGIFFCKFDPLRISQMPYFISLVDLPVHYTNYRDEEAMEDSE